MATSFPTAYLSMTRPQLRELLGTGKIDADTYAAVLEAQSDAAIAQARAQAGSGRAPSATPIHWQKMDGGYTPMIELTGNHPPEKLTLNVLRSILACREQIEAALASFPQRTEANTKRGKKSGSKVAA